MITIVSEIRCPRCATPVATTQTTGTGTGDVTCQACGLTFDLQQPSTDHATAAVPPAGAGAEPQPGESIGAYTLEAELGRGGMGRVYRARHADGNAVALKLLHTHIAADPELVRRFEREISSMSRLDHPRIVHVREHGMHAGRPYLVTDLVGERSLREHLAAGPLQPLAVGKLLEDLFDAVGHLHERGMVHRDLKPENIILDADGRPHVVDFGIVHLTGGDDLATITALTRTDMVVGTLAYMAPEQSAGGPIDHRVDMYALGVIGYEALAGVRPAGRFEDPSTFCQHLSATYRNAWDRLLLALLERDPNQRPENLAACQSMLRACTFPDRPPSTMPVVANTTAAVVLAHAPAPTATAGADASDADAAPEPEPTKGIKRSQHDRIIGGVIGGLAAWTGIGAGWLRCGFLLLAFVGFMVPAIIVYLLALLIIPAAEGVYRPQPLNRSWPARPPGILAGVCALLGERTTLSPVIWRLLCIAGTPIGIPLVYLGMAILLPHQPRPEPQPKTRDVAEVSEDRSPHRRATRFWATAALIVLATATVLELAPSAAVFGDLRRLGWLAGGTLLVAALLAKPSPDGRPRSGITGGMLVGSGITVCLALAAMSMLPALATGLMIAALFIAIGSTGIATLINRGSAVAQGWAAVVGIGTSFLILVWIGNHQGTTSPALSPGIVMVALGLGWALCAACASTLDRGATGLIQGIINRIAGIGLMAVLLVLLAAISENPSAQLSAFSELSFNALTPVHLLLLAAGLIIHLPLLLSGRRPDAVSWPVVGMLIIALVVLWPKTQIRSVQVTSDAPLANMVDPVTRESRADLVDLRGDEHIERMTQPLAPRVITIVHPDGTRTHTTFGTNSTVTKTGKTMTLTYAVEDAVNQAGEQWEQVWLRSVSIHLSQERIRALTMPWGQDVLRLPDGYALLIDHHTGDLNTQ